MKTKRVLVTGGAGFIGSHLCKKLLEEKNEVLCFDNFLTSSKTNVIELIKNPLFELIRHDVTQPFIFEIDEIYHLACPASPVHYQHNPIQTVTTNVVGTLNVLELAHQQNARMLHASTSEVYGDPLIHPQKEDYWGNVNPIGLRSCYDEGKRCAETLAFDFFRKHHLDVKVIRIFNTYGPNMHPSDGRVVSNFIVQALTGEDLTIYGDGLQTRSFCYIDDLISGILGMMSTEKGFIGPINLGNPFEFTIINLAETIIRLTGSKSKVKFEPLPQDDPKQRKPDITLANEKIGWKPKITLEEGLKETIAYFKKALI